MKRLVPTLGVICVFALALSPPARAAFGLINFGFIFIFIFILPLQWLCRRPVPQEASVQEAKGEVQGVQARQCPLCEGEVQAALAQAALAQADREARARREWRAGL
jgi:hypothetical protein